MLVITSYSIHYTKLYDTLHRPEALNAFNVRMRDELYEALSAIRIDDEVRAVIFRGAGDRAFCAGADLKEFLTVPSAVAAKRIREIRDRNNFV